MPKNEIAILPDREDQRMTGLYDVLAELTRKILDKAPTTAVSDPSRVIVELSREIRLSHAAVLQQQRAAESAERADVAALAEANE
tara:strand:- start:57 stop:311 length:255 start_codon:yes stop_codon:yes gene_type:complete